MTTTNDDTAAEAKRFLHEDRVSPAVAAALKQLDGRRWVLYHAQDYLLGCLQLLESRNLLRDREQEEKDRENHAAMLRAFGPAETPRERGYRKLCHLGADALPPSFGEAVRALRDVRTDEELKAAQAPSLLEVHAWRHGGSSEDALALNRVRLLVQGMRGRKTVPMAELRKALGMEEQ